MNSRPAAAIAVIAAAGRGTRLLHHTREVSKSLLQIGGKALIVRNLEILRDQMGIDRVIIVVGHLREQIQEHVGDGSRLAMSVSYVVHPQPDDGLGSLFRYIEPLIAENFLLMLADELYVGSNHAHIRRPESDFRAVVGLLPCHDRARIAQNYGVHLRNGAVTSLVEKPQISVDPYLGCGTYLCSPKVFEDAKETPISDRSGRLELTDVLNTSAKNGRVLPFFLEGDYCNVNTPQDLANANELCQHP